MSTQAEDVKLTFDPSGFIDSINKLTGKIDDFITKTSKGFEDGLGKKTEKTTKETFSNIGKEVGAIAGKMSALWSAGISMATNMVGKIGSYIPEISKTFEIAGDIIGRNMLWPLRKELLPILNGILAWVRDHRGLFVKIGEVLVNVFRTLKTLATSVFGVLKTLVMSFWETIKKAFNFKELDIFEFMNVLMFKIAFLFAFIGAKLKPFADSFGKTIGEVVKFLADLGKAFVDAFSKKFNTKDLTELFKILGEIMDSPNVKIFFDALAKGLGQVAKELGSLAGGALSFVIKQLTELMQVINLILAGKFQEAAFENLKRIFGLVSGLFGGLMSLKGTPLPAEAYDENGNIKPQFQKKQNDAYITKDGVTTPISDQDNIFAFKKLTGQDTTTNNQNVTINLMVTEGNAKQGGINFAQGLQQGMRETLRNELLRQGSK